MKHPKLTSGHSEAVKKWGLSAAAMMSEVDRVIPCAMSNQRAKRHFHIKLALLAFSFASRMECSIHLTA